jgi:hypothetical protein
MNLLEIVKARVKEKTTWIGVGILVLALYPCGTADYGDKVLTVLESVAELLGIGCILMREK